MDGGGTAQRTVATKERKTYSAGPSAQSPVATQSAASLDGRRYVWAGISSPIGVRKTPWSRFGLVHVLPARSCASARVVVVQMRQTLLVEAKPSRWRTSMERMKSSAPHARVEVRINVGQSHERAVGVGKGGMGVHPASDQWLASDVHRREHQLHLRHKAKRFERRASLRLGLPRWPSAGQRGCMALVSQLERHWFWKVAPREALCK